MDDWEPPLERPPPRPKGKSGPIVAVTLLVLAAGGAAYWYLAPAKESPPTPAPVTPAEVVQAPAVPEIDAGVTMEPTGPVDPEVLFRQIVTSVSSSPELRSWLGGDGVFQRLAAAVRLIALGQSPATVLSFLPLLGRFSVREDASGITVAPESFVRYDAIAQALASVDAVAAGHAYARLRPFFEARFREVAKPGEHFDDVLKEALRRLVLLPIPEGPMELVEKGALYAFKDPALEALSPAEKHLLRMGPGNARALQAQARRFAGAAGLAIEWR